MFIRIQKGFCVLLLSVMGLNGEILLNEMMIDPLGSENSAEFVELLNMGDTTVSLEGWRFGDAQDMDLLLFSGEPLLNPGEYALILDPDYDGEYDGIIPDTVLCLTIEDSRFGAYGLSNSVQKMYYLFNAHGIAADSCLSLVNIPEGHSMERNEEGLWQKSHRHGGTPGFRNSVCIPEEAVLLIIHAETYLEKKQVFASFYIHNTGRLSVGSFELSLKDSLTDRLLFNTLYQAGLEPDDSVLITTQWSALSYGKHWIIAEIFYNHSWKRERFEHDISVPADSLFITEFCAVPGEGVSCEYIEFLNTSALPVNLAGMTITDKTGTALLVSEDLYLPECGLGVAAEKADFRNDVQSPQILLWVPSAWRALNNTGDLICWKDRQGNILDSFEFVTSWGVSAGLGLERRSILFPASCPENWASGFSPGLINQATWPDTAFSIVDFKFLPCPQEILISIENQGEKRLPSSFIKMYLDETFTGVPDPANLLEEIMFPSIEPFYSHDICFTTPVPLAGLVTLLFHIPDLSDSVFSFICLNPWPENVLIINEYCPWPGELHNSEYFELFLKGDVNLNLKGFTFRDKTGKVTWDDNLILRTGEYVVFAENQEICHHFPYAKVLIPKQWRTLNNGDDCLAVKDPAGKTQDSIVYHHSTFDIPYQRYSPDLPSLFELNWVEYSPGTPGCVNPFLPADIAWKTNVTVNTRNKPLLKLYVRLRNFGNLSSFTPPLYVKVSYPDDRVYTVSQIDAGLWLHPGESVGDSLDLNYDHPGTGQLYIDGECVISDTVQIYIPYSKSPLTLSEVMNCPHVYDNREWIEIRVENPPVICDGWLLTIDQKRVFLSGILYNEYSVICRDDGSGEEDWISVSGFPQLANKGFVLKLFDPDSCLKDSVDLRNHSEFITGVSLENPRKDFPFLHPLSWHRSRSAEGHTAGLSNSILTFSADEHALLSLEPRIYPRNHPEPMCITISDPGGLSHGEVRLFTLSGLPVRQWEFNIFSAPIVQVFWDGTFTDGNPVPLGLYIVYARVRKTDGSKREERMTAVVNCR